MRAASVYSGTLRFMDRGLGNGEEGRALGGVEAGNDSIEFGVFDNVIELSAGVLKAGH